MIEQAGQDAGRAERRSRHDRRAPAAGGEVVADVTASREVEYLREDLRALDSKVAKLADSVHQGELERAKRDARATGWLDASRLVYWLLSTLVAGGVLVLGWWLRGWLSP